MPLLMLACIFFAIAAVYATVGFGGGSSYLAILALCAIPFQELRLIALVCNVVVVTGGTYVFLRRRAVRLRKMAPLVLASVPCAFAGASFRISQETFFVVLGIALVVAALLLWLGSGANAADSDLRPAPWHRSALLGGAIGLLSGMVGIGGGIFLSPLLNLMRWDTPRRIAATASVFILVNSISGIAGAFTHLPAAVDGKRIAILAGAVLVGGQLGSRLGAVRVAQATLRRVTAVVVFFAGMEVLYKHLFQHQP